ncbi:MAG: hypothetical protein KDD73_07865, partial [Anaerolineales bacterium]|nr:hypothetical protein [Anaerolineales bacterium]
PPCPTAGRCARPRAAVPDRGPLCPTVGRRARPRAALSKRRKTQRARPRRFVPTRWDACGTPAHPVGV